ncbi:MAG TPA: hemerythrin family protein [Dongiaceae bacterium]|nr:hemerythrin family protein [Dongiaceae bacterium]
MSLFSWKPEYSVHDASLDSHHQKLFAILNSVYENVMNSCELDCILPMIDELSAYTKYHFTAEEQYMREKGIPGIDVHMEEHREFTHKIETLRTSYHNNDLEVSRDLIIVLGEWLLKHVIKEDRKYAEISAGPREPAPCRLSHSS